MMKKSKKKAEKVGKSLIKWGGVITVAVVVAVVAIVSQVVIEKDEIGRGTLAQRGAKMNYEGYDLTKPIMEGSKQNGYVSDYVEGNSDADIVIIEYADYNNNKTLNGEKYVDEVLREYGNEVAVVKRTYIWGLNKENEKEAVAANVKKLQERMSGLEENMAVQKIAFDHWMLNGVTLNVEDDDWPILMMGGVQVKPAELKNAIETKLAE